MPRKDTSKHNASCYLCEDTYAFDYLTKKGKNEINVIDEGRKCSNCRRANQESGDDRMSKYTWRSLKEIDASWGAVKRGQLWEEALQAFAQSLPVSKEQQDALIKVMTNE